LKGMDNGIIQIGTAQETSVAELAEMIVEISGKEIPIKFDKDKPEGDGGRSGNYNKAKHILGWDVFTPLNDGLRQTYNWVYKQIADGSVNLEG
jgi:nucleoside-diphosphate-sugar epimerase